MELKSKILRSAGLAFIAVSFVMFVALAFLPPLFPVTNYSPNGYNMPTWVYGLGTFSSILFILGVAMLIRNFAKYRDGRQEAALVRYEESQQAEYNPS